MNTEEIQKTSVHPNDMSIVERVKAPTPKFFKTLRTVGLGMAAVGGVLLASPIAIPAAVVAAAGYITLAGGVMTAVSQTAVETSVKPSSNEIS